MARIRLARIALTKLQKAIFGTRRVALESKIIAYEPLVLSLLLYGSECWVVNAENVRLLQRFHRKCIRIMCRSLAITLGSITSRPRNWRRSWASTTSGTMFIRGCRDTSGTSFVRTQTGLHLSCSAVGWCIASSLQVKPRSFTIPLYRSCLTRHNITKLEALAAQARAASGFSAQVAAQRPSAVTKGRGLHHPHHE